VILIVNNCC